MHRELIFRCLAEVVVPNHNLVSFSALSQGHEHVVPFISDCTLVSTKPLDFVHSTGNVHHFQRKKSPTFDFTGSLGRKKNIIVPSSSSHRFEEKTETESLQRHWKIYLRGLQHKEKFADGNRLIFYVAGEMHNMTPYSVTLLNVITRFCSYVQRKR